MSHPLRLRIPTPGICDEICLKKLQYLLDQIYDFNVVPNPSDNIVLKAELRKVDIPREIHFEVFSNSNVSLISSPDNAPFFPQIEAEIRSMLPEAVKRVCTRNSIRVARAGRIKDYVSTLSVDNEIERMVIVALCDIILDLMVTEKLSSFTHRRNELEDESVGAKIGLLETRYHVNLYKPKIIRDIRELRNKIAHGGTSPATQEAISSRDETFDIYITL